MCLAKGIIIPFVYYNFGESGGSGHNHIDRNLIRLFKVVVLSQQLYFSLLRSTVIGGELSDAIALVLYLRMSYQIK